MSRSLHLHLQPERLPDRASLVAALKSQAKTTRMGLKLDGDWPPSASGAYLPCTLEGEDAGMYCALEATTPPPPEAGLPGHSLRLALRWGGDLREELAAALMAGVLQAHFGAQAFDAEGGQPLAAEALQQRARTLFAQAF